MALICYICYKQLFIQNSPTCKTNYAKLNTRRLLARNQNPENENIQDHQHQPKTPGIPMKVILTTCGHLFHKDCLEEHMQNSVFPEVALSKNLVKKCPICDARFSILNCVSVNAEAQMTNKTIQSRRRLDDLISKTQTLRSKLIDLRIKHKTKEEKYSKILKKIEDIKSSSGEPEADKEIKCIEGSKDQNPDENRVCIEGSNNQNPDVNQVLDDPIDSQFKKEFPCSCNEFSEDWSDPNDLKNKLLSLLALSKSMEKEMIEFRSSMYNTRVSMELDSYRSNNRDYFKSSRCEISTRKHSPKF